MEGVADIVDDRGLEDSTTNTSLADPSSAALAVFDLRCNMQFTAESKASL